MPTSHPPPLRIINHRHPYIKTFLLLSQVCEERTASRRNLRLRKSYSPDASAPPLDYDSEEGQYLNDALTESEKTLGSPGRSSKQSLTDLSRADTFKHSTGV